MGGNSGSFASRGRRCDLRHPRDARSQRHQDAFPASATQSSCIQAYATEGKVARASPSPTRRQSTRWLQRGSLLQVLLILLIGPHLLAVLSSASSSNVGGVRATTELEARAARNAKAAAVAAAESFQSGAQRLQQQPFLANAGLVSSPASSAASQSGADLSTMSIIGTASNISIGGGLVNGALAANRTYIGHPVSVDDLMEQRWGHTAAYLPDAGVILFTGGQIASKEGRFTVTNDVFALNINGTTTASSSSTAASKRDTSASSPNVTVATTAQQQQWIRLSSSNLPPHAFGARAVTHATYHDSERLFLVGGATADCSQGNAPVYVWAADQSKATGWKQGAWTAPTVASGQTLPPRRRGAMAVQVPVGAGMSADEAAKARAQGGISFMVLGGYADYTTCNGTTPINVQQPMAYAGVDVWTITNATATTASQQSKKRDASDVIEDGGERLTVRSMPLDARMSNMSVVDYATVVLPANQTANVTSRVLFVGGRDAYGAFAPMNQLWMLDLGTSQWRRVDTTNGTDSGLDIPLGRMGHSATLLSPTQVLVHGGYTTLETDQMASNDSYMLDLSVAPWVWNKVTPANRGPDSVAPQRAYHTSLMANGILVVGFGQQGMGSMAVAADSDATLSKRQSSEAAAVPVHYLDTLATDQWAWTTNLKALLAARVAAAKPQAAASTAAVAQSTAATASSPSDSNSASAVATDSAQSSASPSDAPSSASVSVAAASTKASSPAASQSAVASSAASMPATSSSSSSSADLPPLLSNAQSSGDSGSDNGGGGGTTPKQRNTAVIASVLGAAAIAASLGGLYAAKRRRSHGSDNDSIGDDKYERFDSNASSGQAAPPVSSLWINQPMSWANGLRRHASMAGGALARTMSFRNSGVPQGATSAAAAAAAAAAFARTGVDDDAGRYSSPSHNDGNVRSFQVLRSLPPTSRFSMRRAEMQRQRDVRTRLDVDNDDGYDGDEHMFDVTLDDDAADEGHGRRDIMTPLPDDFIQTLLDDDDVRAQHDIRRTVGGNRSASQTATPTVRRGPSLLRTRSIESLSSAGSASHFSYPYLAAMHRPSLGDLSMRTSTVQGNLSPGSSTGLPAVSPRDALLRASLSRSPGSQPLYRAMAAASAASSPAWSSPALSAVLRAGSGHGGKNARLVERLQSANDASPMPALPDLHFDNPFADQLPTIPAVSSDSELSSPRATTELDMATTVLGGQDGGYGSPSSRSPMFPWQGTPRQGAGRTPTFHSPMVGGIRMPLHPSLLTAASAQQQEGERQASSRRARPSLLRVTNQGDK